MGELLQPLSFRAYALSPSPISLVGTNSPVKQGVSFWWVAFAYSLFGPWVGGLPSLTGHVSEWKATLLVLGEANTVQRLWSEFKKTNYQGKLHALLPQDSTSAASTFATSTASPSESPSFPVLGQWEDCHRWLSRRWSESLLAKIQSLLIPPSSP